MAVSLKHYRPNTVDERVIIEGLDHNIYRYPGDMSGMICVDIGAHIGATAINAARRGARVFAVEPMEDNFRLLKLNVGEEPNGKMIECINLAVGTPGERKLYVNPRNTGGNSLLLEWTDFGQDEDIFQNVQVVSLPQLMAMHDIKTIDFLKMDCEGAEKEIIEDLMPIHEQVRTISAEFHFNNKNDELVEKLCQNYIHEKLSDHEYKFTHR